MENARFELRKVKLAFDKVKGDITDLKRENFFLRNELSKILNKKQKTKTRTITKTVTKTVVKPSKGKHEVIGNSKTKKVHYSNCSYAKKIEKDKIVKFKTLKDALKKGYHRCSCIFNN